MVSGKFGFAFTNNGHYHDGCSGLLNLRVQNWPAAAHPPPPRAVNGPINIAGESLSLNS